MVSFVEDEAHVPIITDLTTHLEKWQNANQRSINRRIDTKSDRAKRKTFIVPKAYRFCKIHKLNTPLRVIVSTFDSTTQQLTKYIARKFQRRTERREPLKNSTHFEDILKTTTIKKEGLLVSFGVFSLFPKIPIQDTMDAMLKQKILPTRTHAQIRDTLPIIKPLHMQRPTLQTSETTFNEITTFTSDGKPLHGRHRQKRSTSTGKTHSQWR